MDTLKIQPTISLETHEGNRVLVVGVSPSAVPVACRGRYYRRVGNTTREISPDELERFFVAKFGVKWDGIPEAYSFEEFDRDTVQRFVQMAQKRLPYLSMQEPVESILQKLELLQDGKPTRGAMLLFGKNPQRCFLMAEVHMGRFMGVLQRVGTTGKGAHYVLKGHETGERGTKGAPKGRKGLSTSPTKPIEGSHA